MRTNVAHTPDDLVSKARSVDDGRPALADSAERGAVGPGLELQGDGRLDQHGLEQLRWQVVNLDTNKNIRNLIFLSPFSKPRLNAL